MNADKYYIMYEEIPELHSFDAVTKQFGVYTPVYKVMKRRFGREDICCGIAKTPADALKYIKQTNRK